MGVVVLQLMTGWEEWLYSARVEGRVVVEQVNPEWARRIRDAWSGDPEGIERVLAEAPDRIRREPVAAYETPADPEEEDDLLAAMAEGEAAAREYDEANAAHEDEERQAAEGAWVDGGPPF